MFSDEGVRVAIEARPDSFELSPESTAMIVVDMQHDFASPLGMFGRAGIPLDGIQAVVEPTRRALNAARAAGIIVVYLAMQFKPDLSDLGPRTSEPGPRRTGPGISRWA